MTLQIAMICDEGWLLASDRRRTESSALRVRSSTDKIVVSAKLGIAYSCFGDDCAVLVGDELMSNLPSPNPESGEAFRLWLIALGNKTWERLTKNGVTAGISASHTSRGLIICLENSPAKFWLLGIGQQSNAVPITDKYVSGDSRNTARFFVERYHSADLALSRLMLLAVHTIATAEKLNPAAVGVA